MSQAIYNSSLEVEASSLRNKIETKIGKKKTQQSTSLQLQDQSGETEASCAPCNWYGMQPQHVPVQIPEKRETELACPKSYSCVVCDSAAKVVPRAQCPTTGMGCTGMP
jgi:hypothetical protein